MRLNVNMRTMRIWNYEGLDNAAAGGARDYISEVRESSLWAPLCDCLTGRVCWSCVLLGPSGTMRNFMVNLQNYGSSSRKEKVVMGHPLPLPEWPSLFFDYRRNFGFDNGIFEPGRLPDLTAFEDSGKRT